MPSTVIIVGAGPAGCAAAVALADRGHRAVLVGDSAARRTWAGESLPPGATQLVASVFGDDVLDDAVHLPAHAVQAAWGSHDLVATEFIAHPDGDGWHLDRARFDARLMAAAAGRGVEVVRAHAGVAERTPSGWRVPADGRAIEGAWVVDATGRGGGPLRHVAGARHPHDQQVALVALAPARRSPLAATSIEAVPEGWWYSAPLPDGRAVIALITDHDLAPQAAGRTGVWHQRLAATRHLKGLADVGPDPGGVTPVLHAAGTAHRDPLWGDGWAMAGDAAIAWDPLSSQGLMTAMLMGARLGAAISDHEAGVGNALPDWERDYLMLLEEHLALRAHYWTAEQRWPSAPFWERRLALSAP
ncbi:MAG: tryptophan 7-halogenase [Phycisphaerales bacterium]